MIPEEDINGVDSDHSAAVRNMKKLLESYKEKTVESVPNYDDVHGKALLLAMGVSIGDPISIDSDKVFIPFNQSAN